MGVKRICTPSSEALKSSSFMMKPDFSWVVRKRMPRASDLWMFSWPMSRIVASYCARIEVRAVVKPGLSSPEMLTWMISIISY